MQLLSFCKSTTSNLHFACSVFIYTVYCNFLGFVPLPNGGGFLPSRTHLESETGSRAANGADKSIPNGAPTDGCTDRKAVFTDSKADCTDSTVDYTDSTAGSANRTADGMVSTAECVGGSAGRTTQHCMEDATDGSTVCTAECRDRTADHMGLIADSVDITAHSIDRTARSAENLNRTAEYMGRAANCLGHESCCHEKTAESLAEDMGSWLSSTACCHEKTADSLAEESWLNQDSQTVPLLRPNGSATTFTDEPEQQQQHLVGCRSVSSLANCDNGSCQKAPLLTEDSSSDIILV